MAIPSTGDITMSEIQTEFGGSNPISLSEYYAGGDNTPAGTTGNNGTIPSSGAIDMGDFRGSVSAVYMDADGGTETTSGDYKFHRFNSSGTFSVTTAGNESGSDSVDAVIVAGGGGGSAPGGAGVGGGGGGAGGAIVLTDHGVTGTNYSVTVGGGGSAAPAGIHGGFGGNGSNSSAFGNTSTGGGRGGLYKPNDIGGTYGGYGGANGGSGGGGVYQEGDWTPSPQRSNEGGSGISGQGNRGGDADGDHGGGGGGKGSVGGGIDGGTGYTFHSVHTVASGGGGGGRYTSSGDGSSGGGGNGGDTTRSPESGASNTGGGAGGCAGVPTNAPTAGGGSGVVIVRYKYQN